MDQACTSLFKNLALAVGRKESYVRQHIHRKYLAVLRDGRNVTVPYDEAARWARERGLTLAVPTHASIADRGVKDRTARITVLTWHPKDAAPVNLFTHIRHRRREDLGLWTSKPSETWSSEVFNIDHSGQREELRLHTMDAPLEICQELVGRILKDGTMAIDDIEVEYDLNPIPASSLGISEPTPGR